MQSAYIIGEDLFNEVKVGLNNMEQFVKYKPHA